MSVSLFAAPDFVTPLATACVLAFAVLLGWAGVLVRQWHAAPAQRSRAWRIAVLLLAQPLCAALLYFTLWPPTMPGTAGTLTIATAGASRQAVGQVGDASTVIALPEAPSLAGIARVPDLATALRRHPGVRELRIVGAGLPPRDRDAVRGGVAATFDPAPLPRGLIELQTPQTVATGAGFQIGGRANDLRGGHAELLDPGRRRVDRVSVDADGRFVLNAIARVPGAAVFVLRLRDAAQRIVDDVEVPVLVQSLPAPRVLVLAGAPGPEVKYLRRWARDAGLALHTQLSVGGAVQLGDAPLALNAATLGRFDVAVIDERMLSSLADAQRSALGDAVRDGLGLLVRVTAGLSEADRRRLRTLGFEASGGRDTVATRLASAAEDDVARARIGPGTRDAPRAHDAPVDALPELSRRDVRIKADDGVDLARAADDAALGRWRAHGRGRVGVWTLGDSYRLALAGRDDVYGELWSDVLATLARAQKSSTLRMEGEAWVGRRLALCGLAAGAKVSGPDGNAMEIAVDPATGTRACAAFWPTQAGWHVLQSGDRAQPFHVRAADAARGLLANETREATLRLAAVAPLAAASKIDEAASRHAGARWPWFLAWLLASGALWWFERSRPGRRA